MKLNILLAVVVSVLNLGSAFAADNQARQCTPDDWSHIVTGLTRIATTGEEYRSQIQGMIMEELGPRCQVLPVGPGIPGDRSQSYVLKSGDRAFQVTIVVGGVERRGTYLYITKL